MKKTLEDIQEELEQVLRKKRFQHTLGVRYTAQAMAMCFGEDVTFSNKYHNSALSQKNQVDV